MIMTYLREKAGWLIIGFIGFAILAFVSADALQAVDTLFRGEKNSVGSVAGKEITYPEFNNRVESYLQQLQAANRTPGSLQLKNYVVEQIWEQSIRQALFEKPIQQVGIQVTADELFDMVQGKDPDPQIQAAFKDPSTGQFDRKAVMQFLHNMDTSDPSGATRMQWIAFENSLQANRLLEKYLNLLAHSLYETSLSLQDKQKQNGGVASLKYLYLPLESVPDSSIELSNTDFKNYYQAHQKQFKQAKPSRSVDYVVFDIFPSAADSLLAKQDIEQLVKDFKKTKQDSLFYLANTDDKAALVYQKLSALSSELIMHLYHAKVGTVHGPYFEGNAYKVAKLLAVSNRPDSVKARHILLKGAHASHRADSLKTLLKGKKASFAALAKAYSEDTGSKERGGELGYFAEGMMVPAFSEACFSGKVGDLLVVNSQFGTHLIEIENQKNHSKAVKIAVITRTFEPSSQTRQTVFGLASSFLSDVSGKGFDATALAHKLIKREAKQLAPTGSDLAGIENSREIIRWAYRAKPSDISEIFESGDKYVIARLNQITEKGIQSLEAVRSEIAPILLKAQKEARLISKANVAMANTKHLDSLAQKLDVPVLLGVGLSLSNPIFPQAGYQPAMMSAALAMPAAKISKPLRGNSGVFILFPTQITPAAPLTDLTQARQDASLSLRQTAERLAFESLKQEAKITDKRIDFY